MNKIVPVILFTVLACYLCKGQSTRDPCLIASYPFDMNAQDQSGHENHGVVLGATPANDRFGRPNSAYYFDGYDDYIAINPQSDVSEIGDFTISVWANCISWQAQPGIVEGLLDDQYIFDGHSHSPVATYDFFREGFMIHLKLSDNYSTYETNSVRGPDSSSVNELNIEGSLTGRWINIVFVRKGDTAYHYINGELLHTSEIITSSLNMQHTWFIGTFSGNNPYYNAFNYAFQGLIDEVSIYKCALDAIAIDSIYNQNDVSLNENPSLHRVHVYPNPVSDLLYVDPGNESIESVAMYDLYGRMVIQFKGSSHSMDVRNLPPGLYLIKVIINGEPAAEFRILKV